MKKAVFFAVAYWAAVCGWAQVSPPPGTISHPPLSTSGSTKGQGTGGITTTNQPATTVELNQLVGQLQGLQAAVARDATRPDRV